MTEEIENAGIGHNAGPENEHPIVGRLKDKYIPQLTRFQELMDSFDRAPKEAEDEKTAGDFATFIKQINVAVKESEELRTAEKAPYAESGKAVDVFFKMISEPLKECKELLNSRLSKFQKKKADAERARRVAEEAKAREEAQAAANAAAEAEAAKKAAEDAALAAKAAEAAVEDEADVDSAIASTEAAAEAKRAADEAVEAANVAAEEAAKAADKAEASAEAGHADMGRVRSESGVTAASKKSFTGKITDLPNLDLEALRPYLKFAELERAVKEYAKKTNGQALKGAEIEEKYTTMVR